MAYQHLQFLSLLHLYSHGDIIVNLLYTTSFVTLEEVKSKLQLFYCWMGDGASVEGISTLLGKWFTRDHTTLPILVAADDDGDTSEDDDGMWCYCRIAKDGSMNHVPAIKWLYMSCLRMKKSIE